MTNSPTLSGPFNLDIPYTSRISPDLERARSRHYDWVNERFSWSRPETETVYRAADFPQFVARTYPWATGMELDLIIDLQSWSWLWDDSIDRQNDMEWTKQILGAYGDVLYGRDTKLREDPLVDMWHLLLERLYAHTSGTCSAEWRRRHEQHWDEAFDGFLQETANNAAGKIPSFDEYCLIRRWGGGTDISLDWNEGVGRFEPSRQAHASPLMHIMRKYENLVALMSNDLYSFNTEWKKGNTDNIIPVLAQQKNCSWNQAARHAEQIIATYLDRFLDAEDQFINSWTYLDLSPEDRRLTDRFIESMKDWMRGSHEWHLTCPRYQ
jgi:Terpene synthase family 2, C-terminal metal binding